MPADSRRAARAASGRLQELQQRSAASPSGVCIQLPWSRGDFFACQTFTAITGVTYDGGYAEYMIARAEALALVPDELSPVEAAPLMCAGVTTFNGLPNSGARAGELVAVLGLGGLGHLGVQFAARAGFRTVAIARGKDKESLARKLGAWHYIDSQARTPPRNCAIWAVPR